MNQPLVTIQLVVWNGERYLRSCLASVAAQTYPNLEVVIWDNASSDHSREIVRDEFPQYRLVEGGENIGMWPAHEQLLAQTRGAYVLVLSVDVMLDPHFIERAVAAVERDPHTGAIQAKVYRYDPPQLADGSYTQSQIIDTCGFSLTRGRTVRNIGHGERDSGQFDRECEVFGVEGAAPFFRRGTLEDVRIEGHVVDPDFFWYGDDLDLAWRVRIFGWREVFVPSVIAYHDRSTTKAHGRGVVSTVHRRDARRRIPLRKRQLDWVNTRLTIIKNDAIMSVLRDLPWIVWRELMVLGYIVLFEPGVLLALPRFVRLLPRTLRRRQIVRSRVRVSPADEHRWFT